MRPYNSYTDVSTAKTSRRRRIFAIALLVTALVFVGGAIVLRLLFHGPRLASTVTDKINQVLRGRFSVGSIEWPVSHLYVLATGGWMPVSISDLTIAEESGEVIIHAPHVTFEVNLRRLLSGFRALEVRHLVIGPGAECHLRSLVEPTPNHETERTVTNLLLAFRPQSEPAFVAGTIPRAGPRVVLGDYSVSDASLSFDYGSFAATVKGAQARGGTLTLDKSDPLAPKLTFDLAPTAQGGTILRPVLFNVEKVHVEHLRQRVPDGAKLPHDFEFVGVAKTAAGATATIDGALLDHWIDAFSGEFDIKVHVTDAAPILSEFSHGVLGGSGVEAIVAVTGPRVAPLLSVTLKMLRARLPVPAGASASEVLAEELSVTYDVGAHQGELGVWQDGKRGPARFTGERGSIELEGQIGDDRRLGVKARLSKFDARPWLPGKLAVLTGGTTASGGLTLSGTFKRQIATIDGLTVGQSTFKGSVLHNGNGVLIADGLTLSRGGTALRNIRGSLDLDSFAIRLALDVESNDVHAWAQRFSLPALARRVQGAATAVGNLSSLEEILVKANVIASGVPFVDRLSTEAELRYPLVKINSVRADTLGGSLRGAGGLRLDPPSVQGLSFEARGLDLSKTPGVGHLMTGHADANIDVAGALPWPTARIVAHLREWTFAKDEYRDSEWQLSMRAPRELRIKGAIERVAGGSARVDAESSRGDRLSGVATIVRLPARAFLAVAGISPKQADGLVSAHLALGGRRPAPTVAGDVEIKDAWFGRALLGKIGVNLASPRPGVVALDGSFLQGRVAYRGTITTTWPPVADLELTLRRFELDLLDRDFALRNDIKSWVSGKVTYRGPLFADGKLELAADLHEVAVVVANEDQSGRQAPIRLENRSPLRVRYDGTTISILEPVVVRGPAGEFELSGRGSRADLDFRARGSVSAKLLNPYLRRFFEDMSGDISLEGRLSGSLKQPRYTGEAEFFSVTVKPQGQDTLIAIPAGKILFSDDQFAATGLELAVIDEFSKESEVLKIAGGVRFKNFRPHAWAVRIQGKLGGKLLLAALPNQLSAATGAADVSLSLMGIGTAPRVDGVIAFAGKTPLRFTPRGLRKELELTTGTIRITDEQVEFEDVTGRIDDEGVFSVVDGNIKLAREGLPLNPVPEQVEFTLSARDVPMRVPGELELRINVPRLRIVGGLNQRYRIVGEAEIVDGRYVRKWQPILDVLRPIRSSETSAPFYADLPWLANAELAVDLNARAFFVKNNIADIDLAGGVAITGTPESPRFEGVVAVERGSFKFQGIRAKFTRTRGTVTFSRFKEFPNDTPYLRITSESDFRDTTGTDHVVNLVLEGPLSSLQWDLSTQAGLNKGQTFTLIFAGRTPEEARRTLLGDEAIGGRPGSFSGSVSTAEDAGTLVAMDQVVKDLAGDFFALLIEDPIRNFTTLDVARLELGTASIGFRGEKAFTRSIRVIGEVDRSYLRGWSWDVRGEYRLTDSVSVDGEVLQKNYDDDAEQDQTNLRAKLTWRRVLIP